MKPKKLIRKEIIYKIQLEEWECIHEKGDLYKLYDIKIREELNEIVESERNDIMEFADLIQVAFDYARESGFSRKELMKAVSEKAKSKGRFSNIALNNLNPNNPSNNIYFKNERNKFTEEDRDKLIRFAVSQMGIYWDQAETIIDGYISSKSV